jgi:serine/threonine protein kinase
MMARSVTGSRTSPERNRPSRHQARQCLYLAQWGAKVLDFGVAQIAFAKEDLTHPGLLMGTLRYMSPEQARGRVDQRSDMFSAAAVFYELVAYHPPASFEDPMAVLTELHLQRHAHRFRPTRQFPRISER